MTKLYYQQGGLKMDKITFELFCDNGEEKATLMYEARELGNDSGYGSGQYISLASEGSQTRYIDCRYMEGYNLKDAATNELKHFFGNNLKSIKVVNGDQ